jgi:acetamidase/formamidase
MTLHTIEPTVATLHGVFWRDFAPVVTIDPGDTIHFTTLDAGWGLDGPEEPRRYFQPRLPGRGNGHALCGPVAVRGALPGTVLEVVIHSIRPGPWGWSVAGGWDSPLNRRLGVVAEKHRLNWWLDEARTVARDQFGRTVPVRPFMGVMGMPPDEPGLVETFAPRVQGGNLDCRELVAGSSLFLPVAVPGGLFSVGDGHAAQGDGEVSSTGIECPMERVELEFRVHTDAPLATPYACTPAGWVTLGFHEDLNEATAAALEAMLLLMQATHGMSRVDAVALASLCVNLRITQVVNGVRGVHAVLPHDAFAGAVS